VNVTVGIAPDSWGIWFPSDPKQVPWNRFLDEVVQAGYEWIELGPYGFLPSDLPTLRHELDRRGLRVAGQAIQGKLEDPAAWPELERQVFGAGELLAGTGARFLVLIDDSYVDLVTGRALASPTLTDDEWPRLISTTHRVADLARDRFGLALAFHPHVETHAEYEGQMERFLAETDPARVGLCFDTGHHAYRGGDVLAFLRRHHDRIPYLHLKSIDPAVQARVQAEQIPFGQAVGMAMFCEPWRGAIDFLALRDLLREIDYAGFAIVEQDCYPTPPDRPLPIAKRTREYLREIGID
jgi:inosose dehydratase